MSETINYRAYLRSPKWQGKRQRMLAKAKNRCQVCNGDGQLHVHHRTYKNIGNEFLSDLVVLCRDCHALFHGKLPLPPPSEKALKKPKKQAEVEKWIRKNSLRY